MIEAVMQAAIWGAIGGVCLWTLGFLLERLWMWWEPIGSERRMRRYRKENGL